MVIGWLSGASLAKWATQFGGDGCVVIRWFSDASLGERVTQFGVDGKVVILP